MAYGSMVDLALHFNKPLAKAAPVEIQPTNPGMTLLGVTVGSPVAGNGRRAFPGGCLVSVHGSRDG